MGFGGEFSVLELDGTRLTAVTALVSNGRVEVTRWLSAVLPETVAVDDAMAVGHWIGSEFRRAGLPRGRVLLAVARGDIVLKQLSIPAGADASDADIAGVVRLQLVRQLTMPLDGAVIDYAAGGEEGAARLVLAGAMPAERVAWCRDVAKAAGMKLRRIGLRCFGAAALLADLSQRRAGPVLGVSIGAGSTEFVVVDDGQMVLARAADLARPGSRAEIDSFAERVAVEAKRTWMSFRAMRAGVEGPVAVALGEGDLAKRVAERCAAALEARGETLAIPASVTCPSHMPESDRAAAAPLVGLLLEQVVGRPTLDFANPRKLPDTAARRRQLAMAGVLGLILLGGGAYVGASQKLASIEHEITMLRERESKLRGQRDRMAIDHARVTHAELWSGARIDWMAHLKALGDQLPEPSVARLEEIRGRMAGDGVFAPSGSAYLSGKWTTRQVGVFDLTGVMDDRRAAEQLRDRLLSGGVYAVEVRGADVENRFSLELSTDLAAPPSIEPPGEPPPANGEAKPAASESSEGGKAPKAKPAPKKAGAS